MTDITLIPGSGLGPIAAEVVVSLAAKLGAGLRFDRQDELEGAIASLRHTKLALKGKWIVAPQKGVLPLSVRFRKALGVHTIVRHVKTLPGLRARADVDLVIVREASEDIYAGFEHESADGVFESVKVTTRAACERVHRAAFELAAAHGRKKVTTVHKANILKRADGMFLRVGQEVAAAWPGITHSEVIVDALCMDLVRRPQRYDVLVCGNLFGDIVSDCAAGMAGGITVATGVAYGPEVTVFENPHGAMLDAVHEDAVNPLPMVRLLAQLLRHVGDAGNADRVDRAIAACLAEGCVTPDLGGSATTARVHDHLLSGLG